MIISDFIALTDAGFYAGVPDSLLSPLADHLMKTFGADSDRHVIAANEGNALALAAGYHLATGGVPAVYLQNSGEGNLLNPYASLSHPEVYGIPMLLIIGHRGEPGVKDEPQHIFQGRVTIPLLELLEIPSFVLGKDTTKVELARAMEGFREEFKKGRTCAVVVKKGALETEGEKYTYKSIGTMLREEAIKEVLEAFPDGLITATTGKIGRETYELREAGGEGHDKDFLCVGSMGHALSLALGLCLYQKEKRVICLDGDGALLMHMGGMAVTGSRRPRNLVHVLLNNGAHESVGGMPTAAGGLDLPAIAEACGYPRTWKAEDPEELKECLKRIREEKELAFLEIRCALGARKDLGRPRSSPAENKRAFMENLGKY